MIKEIIIKTDDGNVVAHIIQKDSLLDGQCTWWNLEGVLVAEGMFKNGQPWEGTFLNWNHFIDEPVTNPFEPDFYCDDWVTFFESSHLSMRPDYDKLKERYENGVLVKNKE